MSRQYKEFKVGDLFTIERGDITNQGKLKDYERGVSFVAQNVRDNGYVKRIKQEEYKVFEGNSIIVGRQTGVVHYQEDEFVTTDGVLVLKGDIIKNKNMGLYLTTMLKSNMRGFGYTNPVTATKLKDIDIEIPIDQTGAIDCQYMEDYMKEIESEAQQTIETLDKISTLSRGGVSNYPEPYGYKEFTLGDLFEYERGARIKKSDRVEGNIPLVTAGKINTGVSGYIEIHNKYAESPCLTIDMFGNTFYRDYPFYYDDNIIVFKNKKYSKWVYLYICGAVSYLQNIYSYTKQFRVKEIDNNYVKVPVTSQGVPDWQYMEYFMRLIEQDSEELINKIQTNV